MAAPPPPADKAAQWNTYIVAVIPYRAAIHQPPPRALQHISSNMSRHISPPRWLASASWREDSSPTAPPR
eukprot:12919149-Prorocentrum_lima.AAC.1